MILDLTAQLTNLRAHWLGWSGSSGGVDDDLPIYRSGVPHNLLNGVLRVRGTDLDEATGTAGEALAGVPWRWWVGPDSDPGTADGLTRRGYRRLGAMPVMAAELGAVPVVAAERGATSARAAELGPVPAGSPAAGLTVEEVRGEEAVEEYVDAYLAAFSFPEGLREGLVAAERRDGLIRLAGRVDGRVVATAAVLPGGEVAGLYWIGTVPDQRGRGIGAELTAAALRVARDHGAAVATLQASTMGEPVYRRLGFTAVSEVELFVPPGE